MGNDGIAPRRAAVALLDGVLGDGRMLSDLTGRLDRLAPEDRARAQRLAVTVLRELERADRVLAPYLKKKPPLTVLNVLRLGTVELCAEGAAAHGVVHAGVEIVARGRRTGHLKGLANAVLRRVSEAGGDAWAKLPPSRLPGWLRQPLVAAWGRPAVTAMETAQAKGAPLDLTAKTDAETVAKAVGGMLTPTGSVRLETPGQVSALPGYKAGDWWVQDAAAALPAKILAPQPGEHVLDLCAAPGGKTLQLAAAGATVTAVDISEARMARVSENLDRTGLKADFRIADAMDITGTFDAVLVDAPCSATGTLRRHPDLPFVKDGSDFVGLFDLQARLIDHAATLLRPGGRMVFCTCSLLPDEGEVQIEEALSRHPELTVDPTALKVPGVAAEWLSEEGGLRLRPDYWPEIGGMDGFYIALLRKAL